jgi:flagellar motor protein MotB
MRILLVFLALVLSTSLSMAQPKQKPKQEDPMELLDKMKRSLAECRRELQKSKEKGAASDSQLRDSITLLLSNIELLESNIKELNAQNKELSENNHELSHSNAGLRMRFNEKAEKLSQAESRLKILKDSLAAFVGPYMELSLNDETIVLQISDTLMFAKAQVSNFGRTIIEKLSNLMTSNAFFGKNIAIKTYADADTPALNYWKISSVKANSILTFFEFYKLPSNLIHLKIFGPMNFENNYIKSPVFIEIF